MIRPQMTWVLRVMAYAACAACAGAARPGELGAADPDTGLGFRLQHTNPGGMWLPPQMALPLHVDTLRNMGARIDAAALADPFVPPLGAIVSLGGCTGSFISRDGLIATNHHCIQDVLRARSSPSRNLVEHGYLARTRAAELPVPEQRVFIDVAFRDVTAQVRESLTKIQDPEARARHVEHRLQAMFEACNQRRVRCTIRPYFGGAMYFQTDSIELRDVRLVYAPPRSVGNYGGEVDNWKWPRHCGDWALFRAYVRSDRARTTYAASNVPFRPRSYLHVSTAGVRTGDFVMIAGYPGVTSRMRTAASIRSWVEHWLPYQIAWDREHYAIAERAAAQTSEAGIAATVAKQLLQNDLAKAEAMRAALTGGDAMAQKDAFDQRVRDWASQSGHEIYRLAFDKLDQLDANDARTARADVARAAVFGSSQLLSTALSLVRWAEQRTLRSEDRKAGFQDSHLPAAVDRQTRFTRTHDRAQDRAALRGAMVRALELPEDARPWLAALVGADPQTPPGTPIDEAVIDRALEGWYRAPPLESEPLRLSLLKTGTLAQLAASPDPFLRAALRLWPIVLAEERRAYARQGDLLVLTPLYVDALVRALGVPVAPDANGSLRISYGTVKSMSPASHDPADGPFTVASQILAKNTGVAPFDAPANVLAAIKARTFGPYGDPALGGDLPIDFLSDLDVTNGNSGSPVLDRRGDLVGLAFDGTLEGVTSDVVFNPATARTIAVDVRYLIWTMDLLDDADDLIEEMGLTPRLP